MPTLPVTVALLLSAGALATGALVAWVHFRLRTGAQFVSLATHREELMALRRRYRRRLRAMRDAVARQRAGEAALREEQRAAAAQEASRGKLLTAAQAEIATLRERIAALDAELRGRDARLAAIRAHEESLAAELSGAQEKIAAFERDHGLLRIERDELVARTARLRALPAPGAQPTAAEADATRPGVAPRAELADRDARIHELECQLHESEGRVTELETSLQTWKYRIAPLALHMKLKRERALAAAAAAAAPPAGPDTRRDDLKRIHGIGRGLEKKLRAEGVTGFAQLAAMSPAELANLAVRVGVAASRPERDRWAEQAGELTGHGPESKTAQASGRAESA